MKKTNLQALRKAAGFKSANAFADHMGINRSTYIDYEQGRIALTLEKAWLFADFFNVTLDELVGRKPVPSSASESKAIDLIDGELAQSYQQLNAEGKQTLLDHADTLVKSGKYESKPEKKSMSDIRNTGVA